MMKDIGDRFQKETNHIRGKLRQGALGWEGLELTSKPALYKSYPINKIVKLSLPNLGKSSLRDYLGKRHSIRRFSKKTINEIQLAYLLWASTGIQRKKNTYEFRTAPSAGALYPIETYLVINRVENIPQGIYHYSIKSHHLEELLSGDSRKAISSAALGQKMCSEANVVFIWTAIFDRSKWKYKQRAYRYIYLETGHIAQNLALAAVDIGLVSCQIGALYDDEVNQLLGINGLKESVVYMSSIGFSITP